MGPLPIKVNIFILEDGNFGSELKYYIQDLASAGRLRRGHIREDSPVFSVSLDAAGLKSYHNKISSSSSPYYSIIGSDDTEVRHKLSELIVKPCMSFKHYSVVDYGSCGKGSIVLPGVVIGPKAVLAEHVLCKANSTIGANVQIGECSVVDQNVSVGANTKIGDRVHIGAGAVIKENLLIGSGIIIKMGEIVTQNRTIGDINES